MRKLAGIDDHILRYKELEFNSLNGNIKSNQTVVELTPNEMKVLAYLMHHQREVVPREALMEVLWEAEIYIDDNTLSVTMARLRKKLEEIGMARIIKTKRGIGYILE